MNGESNEINTSNDERKVSRGRPRDYIETKAFVESHKTIEIKSEPEVSKAYTVTIKNKEDIKKERQKAQVLIKTAAVVAVVAVSTTTNVISLNNNVKVEEAYVSAGHNEIFYEFELSGYDGEEITVRVYNDFTNREQTVKEHFITGVAEHLKPNVTYNIVVQCEGKKIYTKTLTTYEQEKEEYYQDVDDENQGRYEEGQEEEPPDEEPYEEKPIEENEYTSDEPNEEEPIDEENGDMSDEPIEGTYTNG